MHILSYHDCCYSHIMIWSIALWYMFANVIISSSGKKICEKKRQSPVNLMTDSARKENFSPLNFSDYSKFINALMEIKNNGHTVEVEIKNSSQIPIISGGPLKSNYKFVQLHLHWGKMDNGSEHRINGLEYATEIHVVHYNIKYGNYEKAIKHHDGLCVVAIFGKISEKNNPNLKDFIDDLRNITQPTDYICKPFLPDFSWLLNIVNTPKQHYFTYYGSLTTAPYTECVKWIVLTKKFKISQKQLLQLRTLHSDRHNREVISHNERRLQPLCGRQVFYQ